MHLEKLSDLISENKIAYCVIADLDMESIETIGCVTELEYKDLVEQLFYDMEQIKVLNFSLIGQQLPRSWKQGKVKCLICKPKDSIVVGLFYNEYRMLSESIDFGCEIAKKIDNMWK
ncbi:hypothetical protein [Sinanaerobacter sp. ZZT-01]|uniref:hypothetical protein n=1 Tax=Sinanaerobacter sp. ZZT-01 TaxID=3111540 RepID=UPI002D79A96E|nr:hypothetical protein [Sinanaerobacter sp. ZZT-01]WRR92357.1 hypothetical protein U5921_09810 [Sinanaerobacter sp. ZZT-01]